MKPVIGIIGAGKVGSTLARLWYNAGFTIGAVYSRSEAKEILASKVNSLVVNQIEDVVARCDLSVLSVPDDAIVAVANQIVSVDLRGKGIIHVAGTGGVELLTDLELRGAMTGSLHPVFPFASEETSLLQLPRSSFAVEAQSSILQGWLYKLVEAVDGQIIMIPPGKKALYHAALVIASNYTVILYGTAERLLTQLGGEQEAIQNALHRLFAATVSNLALYPPSEALTGPLVRGDVMTLETHLQTLAGIPEVADMYRIIALVSLPLLRERGLSEKQIQHIVRSLNST